MTTVQNAPAMVSRVADITPTWLTGALRAAGAITSGTVTSAEGQRVGMGQVAHCIRLTLEYDVEEPGAPRSLIAKIPSTDQVSRAAAAQEKSYAREVNIYREVVPTLDVTVPRCYFVDIDESGTEFMLLLEDLAPAEACDQLSGCSADQAGRAMDQLSALHASGWRKQHLQDNELLRIGIESWTRAATMMPDPLLAMFKERYDDLLAPQYMRVAEDFAANVDGFIRALGEPTTVMHGDFRLDNLLFGGRGGQVPLAVLDWQLVSLGPNMFDVAYFLGASLTTDLRREHERDLVQRYHQGLLARGIQGYSFDECWTDYRRFAFAGLLMAVAASVQVEQTERGDEMFITCAARHAQQILDHNAFELITV